MMGSNGGLLSVERTCRQPVALLLRLGKRALDRLANLVGLLRHRLAQVLSILIGRRGKGLAAFSRYDESLLILPIQDAIAAW